MWLTNAKPHGGAAEERLARCSHFRETRIIASCHTAVGEMQVLQQMKAGRGLTGALFGVIVDDNGEKKGVQAYPREKVATAAKALAEALKLL